MQSNAIHTPLVGHGLVILTAGYPVKKVIALRPGAVADGQRVAWEYSRGTGYVLSNILYGDYLYLFTDNGIVTCLDPKTGAVKYEGGRIPVPARFMGSPVAFGGFVAMTSEEGDTFMLKAGPTHEIVRTNSIDEAGLFVARDCQRTDLHPRRQAPVRDREVASREPQPTYGWGWRLLFDPAVHQAPDSSVLPRASVAIAVEDARGT